MELSPETNDSQLNDEKLSDKNSRLEGFDIFRAIFSISIIAYKTKLFYLPTFLVPTSASFFLSDYILSGIVGAIAVPVFLQMSLFIFDSKRNKLGSSYFFESRLPRLIKLYLFWIILITLYDILFVDKILVFEQNFSSLKRIMLFVVSGHNTPYFFFFSLIFLTICSEILISFLKQINEAYRARVIYLLLLISCMWIFTCSALDSIINYKWIQLSFLENINKLTRWDYNPLNFLPYIFTAAITSHEYDGGKIKELNKFTKQKLTFLLSLSIIFFVLEWTLTSNKFLIQVDQAPLDHYMRLSLLFGSWFLLYIALIFKQQAPRILKAISNLSLGIYGFHVFFIFKKPLSFDKIYFLENIFQAFPSLQILTTFLITLFGSIVLSLIFQKIKLTKRFVA